MPKKSGKPPKLPSAWAITRQATLLLRQHWQLFASITLIYGLLNFIFVQGFSSGNDVASLKQSLSQAVGGNLGLLGSGLGTFVVMVGSSGNTTNQTAGAYQGMLAIISSLAIIWALRKVVSGNQPSVRDVYYHGMTPFVPFLIVLFIISLQLLPLVIGTSLYSLVVSSGIAAHAGEKLLWSLLSIVLSLVSLYFVSASAFALYIVTLPGMKPLKALRSARELVRNRRWTVLRKLLWLPVALLLAAAIIMLPIILVLTAIAQWVFFLLTMCALTASLTYIYTLYRELLNE